MSEKIYACLLRLFPPTFRRQYQQEIQRLLRDRLREEKGFFRRLRLGFDLSVDLIDALPQAYRNSYPQAAPASCAPRFDGVPSFQVLQKEPMRRGVVLVGGFVSVTALAAFIYVMQGPVAFHPAERKGHKSPIELVMEHLNQPLTVDAANKAAFRSDSTATGDQPARMVDQNPKPIDPRLALSHTVSTSSRSASPESVQATPIPVLARSASGLTTGVMPTPPTTGVMPTPPTTGAVLENISPGWTGTWRAVNGDADLPRWFSFRQNGARLNGSGGPNRSAQYPIVHSAVTGESVSFELHAGQTTFLYDLEFQNEGLRGTVSVTSAKGTRTVAVGFERVR